MAVSRKIKGYVDQGGWIRRMFEAGIELKRQYGEDAVLDLSLGNPVVEPPPEFHRELRRLAEHPERGMHRYMPNAGYPETREAVAGGLREETGVPFTAGEIVMTCGAAAALNVVLKTVLNPGEEVVLFAPYFVEYVYYTDNHGGVPVIVPTGDGFPTRTWRRWKGSSPPGPGWCWSTPLTTPRGPSTAQTCSRTSATC